LDAAAVAALSIPPWPLQAPRPPFGDVLPSLQVTGVLPVSARALDPVSVRTNTAATAAQIEAVGFGILIDKPPSSVMTQHLVYYVRPRPVNPDNLLRSNKASIS
jgi:hypothetical protein